MKMKMKIHIYTYIHRKSIILYKSVQNKTDRQIFRHFTLNIRCGQSDLFILS